MHNLRGTNAVVQMQEPMSVPQSVGAHEDDVNAIIKEFRHNQQITREQFAEAACRLRSRRIDIENQIDELNSEVEDLNRAIRAYRHECGVEDQDMWVGYDDNHEPSPYPKGDSLRR